MESFLRDGVDLNMISANAISTVGSAVGDAHFFEDSTPPIKVRQFLDSNKEFEKLRGMKWLLAMLSKGKEVSEFFPDVVKNVVVKSIEVKKMVYLYLVHYADYNAACREISLLSINSFQKDMSGDNPLIRGLALRVMTSIRVADLIQLQLLAVRKCATDSSPYVRKCAATALTKIYALDSEQLPHLKQIMTQLLKDSQTMVLGSVIASFNEICPTSYEILHKAYRKLCHLLADLDEWTQIITLEVLCRYTRNQFIDPAPGVSAVVRLQIKQRSTSATKGSAIGNTVKRTVVRKAFYSDEEDELDEEEVELLEEASDQKPEAGSVFSSSPALAIVEGESNLDPDHRLVLRSSQPLLKSRNSGVVLGVCMLHYYCGSHSTSITQQIGKSLVRILRDRREIQYMVLNTINIMAHERPSIFKPFLSEFFIKASDPIFNRLLKLEVLSSICSKENMQSILQEFQIYIKHSNVDFVCATIRSIGRIADVDNSIAPNCMQGLLSLVIATSINAVSLAATGNGNNTTSGSSSAGSKSKKTNVSKQSMDTSLYYTNSLNTIISTAELSSDRIIEESVVVIRQLIQQQQLSMTSDKYQDSSAYQITLKTLQQLIKMLIIDQESHEQSTQNSAPLLRLHQHKARASIVWLIGEFYDMISKVAIDLLRILTKGFIEEHTETKQQIVNMAVKLTLRLPDSEQVQSLMIYILELARYDQDTDLRDRTRVLTALMGLAPSNDDDDDDNQPESNPNNNRIDEDALADLAEHGNKIMLATKLPPVTVTVGWGSLDNDSSPSFNLGSMSSVMGHYVTGYESLPSWPLTQPDPSVRELQNTSTKGEEDGYSDDDSDRNRKNKNNINHQKSVASNNLNGFYEDSHSDDSDSSDDSESDSSEESDSSDEDTATDDDDNDDDNSSANNSDTSDDDSSNDDDDDDSSDDESSTDMSSHHVIPTKRSTMQKSVASTSSTHTAAMTTQSRTAPMRKIKSQGQGHNTQNTAVKDIFAVNDTNSSHDLLSSDVLSGQIIIQTTNTNLIDHAFSKMEVDLLNLHTSDNHSGSHSQITNNNNSNNNNNIYSHSPNINQYDQLNLSVPLHNHNQTNTNTNANANTHQSHLHNTTATTASSPYGLSSNPRMMMMNISGSNTPHTPTTVTGTGNTGNTYLLSPVTSSLTAHQQQQQQMMFMSPSGNQPNNSMMTMTANNSNAIETALSEPKVILKPELSGGLSVLLQYRFNAVSVSLAGSHCAYIVIQNNSDHTIRRIKISLPSDIRWTKIDDIPLLNAGQSIWLPIELVLSGLADRSVRVDIRCDTGSYVGNYTPSSYELILPLRMFPAEFEALRKKLIGLTEVKKSIPIQTWLIAAGVTEINIDDNTKISDIETIILDRCRNFLNISVIQNIGNGELMLSGVCRKSSLSDERVLITVITTLASETTLLRINCDDPVLSTSLMEFFTKVVTKSSNVVMVNNST